MQVEKQVEQWPLRVASVPKQHLHKLETPDLIDQYNDAISSYAGRYTNFSPRQKRIDHIVDLISERADNNDPHALAWYEKTE